MHTLICTVKRDGKTEVPFDANKIAVAISKAAYASGEQVDAASCTAKVLLALSEASVDGKVGVETIQDEVERVLMMNDHYLTAKKYIIYRQHRTDGRAFKISTLTDLVDEYLGKCEWSIKENSNMDFSLQGLNQYVTAKAMSAYWLAKIFPPDVREAHNKGTIHVHDLNLLAPYCCGWDLRQLLLVGFSGVEGSNDSKPAKHFQQILGQCWNFLFTLQGEAAGAQAFSNFDTYLAPFIRFDKLSYREVKKALQTFFHNMTTKTRVGFQSPFTNITMDLTVPRYMKDEPVIRGGEFTDYTYGEFQEEMNIFNRALCEVMIEGDASGRQFSFPIPTYSITKDFDWDNEVLEPLWKLTAMYGAPYFTNYVNSDLNPEDVRSMCPLHPDEKIHVKINGSWMNMTIYAVYSFLANKMDKSEVYVMHKGKEIPVTGVSVHAAETFVRIRTVLDPDGVVFEGGHHQPFRTDEFGPMKKSTARSLRVGEYLPYSESTRENVGCPDDCFAQDGYVFAKITHKEILGKIHPYAYCIEVGTEDHLFDLKPGGLVTHNCRLQLDLTTLRRRGGGQFGANPLTGSIGVVTLNLPAMAYNAKGDKSKFFEAIIDGMEMAREILTLKREFVEKNVTLGLYPYTRRYLEDVAMVAENVKGKKEYMYNHFSTIGIVGGNEACLNLLGKSIMDDEGKDLMIEVLTMMRERCQKYAEETGYPFNLEATPAEGVSYRLAKLDQDQYPDIITASSCVCGADPFYTNSTQVPVNATTDIVEVCDNQDDLQTLYTGGTVMHVMLGEAVKDPTVVKNLVRKLCSSYRIPYFTISPNYSVCANHGYLKGVQDSCPKCGGDTEIYSRVVGFYTPVSRWNKGKVQEFSMRNTYETSAVPLGEEDK